MVQSWIGFERIMSGSLGVLGAQWPLAGTEMNFPAVPVDWMVDREPASLPLQSYIHPSAINARYIGTI